MRSRTIAVVAIAAISAVTMSACSSSSSSKSTTSSAAASSGGASSASTGKGIKADTITVRNVKRYPGEVNMLSAGDSGATPEQAYLVYDVDKLLGPLPPGGVRVLTYEGGAAPPDFRGVFWSASADGNSYAKLSTNEFGKLVPFRDRYLKVGLSWRQASDPGYGHLTRFRIAQWKRPAGK